MSVVLRIDDVGRTPADSPEHGTDSDLTYFQEWREAIGLRGLPVIYAAVPQWLSSKGLDALNVIEPPERVAVHGWDHKKGWGPDLQFMELGRRLLGNTTVYVPPFNFYDMETMQNWSKVGGRFFLGGHEDYPSTSCLENRVCHIKADASMYGKVFPVKTAILARELNDQVAVATLHIPWDKISDVRGFAEEVKDYLVDLYKTDTVFPSAAVPNLKKETAPHYLAYSWILSEISQLSDVGHVLDFGARYSRLPTMLTLRGFNVTAADRDKIVLEKQVSIPAEEGVSLSDIWVWNGSNDPKEHKPFDAIVATWVIQHNSLDDISSIVKRLSYTLRAGGHLLIVGSYTNGSTHYQSNRKDPQWILNDEDYLNRIIKAADFREISRKYFWYQHNTEDGDFCDSNKANAICLHLKLN